MGALIQNPLSFSLTPKVGKKGCIYLDRNLLHHHYRKYFDNDTDALI